MSSKDRAKKNAESELRSIGFDGFRFEEYALYQQPNGSRRKIHCVYYTVTDGNVRVFMDYNTYEIIEVLTPGQGLTPYLESFKYVSDDPSDSLPENDDSTDPFSVEEEWKYLQAN